MFKYTIPQAIQDELVTIHTGAEAADAEITALHKTITALEEKMSAMRNGLGQEIGLLKQDLAAIEEKLDLILPRVESIPLPEKGKKDDKRSIPVEPMALAPGKKPWSQRKAERIANSSSSTFIDKVIKGAAPTEIEPLVATEE